MKSYLKYIPFLIGMVLIFFAGRCSKESVDKDLVRKYELERKTLLEDVAHREGIMADRTKQAATIIQRMKQDSAKLSVDLQARNGAIFKLEKYYASISFRDADGVKLDSILSVLY